MKTIHTLRYFLWVMLVMFLAACQKEEIVTSLQESDLTTADQREKPSKPIVVDLPPVVRVFVPGNYVDRLQLKHAIRDALIDAKKDSVDADGKKLDQHSYNLVIKALEDSLTLYNLWTDYLEYAAFAQVRFVMSKVGGQIHVYVIRYQVIKNDSPLMRAHEDGHSEISKQVAQGCADKARERAEASEKNPVAVNNKIRSDLNGVDKAAQKRYDELTMNGTKGDIQFQKDMANLAAQEAVANYNK